MKTLQSDEEPVEYKVGGEHGNELARIIEGRGENPGGEDDAPGDNPDTSKEDKEEITRFLVVEVAQHLSHLKNGVGTVMYKKYQCTDTDEVSGP